MKGKKAYCIIRVSWNGGGYSFEDALIYENEEDRDKALEDKLARQRASKIYDWDFEIYEPYETEIK